MENIQEKTVAELVSEDISRAHIFKKYGIDFCCGGGITVSTAAERKGVNVAELCEELLHKPSTMASGLPYNKWTLSFLSDYIVNTHHTYVRESIVLLNDYATKVVRVHGAHHPVLHEIKALYDQVAADLSQHMLKEERILFPYIKRMEEAKLNGADTPELPFGRIENPINMMHAEHELAGDLLKQIADLTMHYTPPEWACNTFKALYAKLQEFEEDLHIHVHLENNILFPKAIDMDK